MNYFMRKKVISILFSLLLSLPIGIGLAQKAVAACTSGSLEKSGAFTDFKQYLSALQGARFADYQNLPGTRVASEAEFEKMRQHLLDLYQTMRPSHSFADEHGQTWDVIPVGDQPALRGEGGTLLKIAATPEASYIPEFPGDALRPMKMPFAAGRHDAYGNEMYAGEGFVPFKRQTLANLVRFATLKDSFLLKSVDGGNHAYAIAQQNVSYVGAGGMMSIYGPDVNENQTSISQIWISAGNGGGLQTIESGAWSNCGFGTSDPTFFVLASSNNYNVTCQNLNKCHFSQTGKSASYGFVQTGNVGIVPGATFPNVSENNATVPFSFAMSWVMHASGNWWLWIEASDEGGVRNGGWLGYFPKEIFAGGPLATAADSLEFGGEAAIYGHEQTYAAMGDGTEPTDQIDQQGGFHIHTWYMDAQSNIHKSNLAAVEAQSGACYGVLVKPNDDGDPNAVYFGGPGGVDCPD